MSEVEVLRRAENATKARINEDGECSCCRKQIEPQHRERFCYYCGATFMPPEEIASGKLLGI